MREEPRSIHEQLNTSKEDEQPDASPEEEQLDAAQEGPRSSNREVGTLSSKVMQLEAITNLLAVETASRALLQEVAVVANRADAVPGPVRFVLHRLCAHAGWRLGHLCLLAEDGSGELVPTRLWHPGRAKAFTDFRRATLQSRWGPGQELPGQVLQTGKAVWLKDLTRDTRFLRPTKAGNVWLRSAVAFPVLIGTEVIGVLEFFADKVAEPDPRLLEVLVSVGTQLGRVFERFRSQRQMTEAIGREQRRLGQELHDTVRQELTGIEMMAKHLERKLHAQRSAEADRAADLAEGVQRVGRQINDLARGLFLPDIEATGLHAALADLAERTQRRYGIACRCECDRSVSVRDSSVASHLFLIAQEAITNAVKHAQAKQVVLGLAAVRDGLQLLVRDDGVGLSANLDQTTGLGWRIMRCRAGLIGATLEAQRPEDGGTAVICTRKRERQHGLST